MSFGGSLYRRELTVWEVVDLVFTLPPGCATWRAVGGVMAWPEDVHALIAIADVLRVANWQRTDDGAHGRNPPRPLPRPELNIERPARHDEAQKVADNAQIFLARRAAREQAEREARAAAGDVDDEGG